MKKKMMLATVLSLALSAFAQNDGYAEYAQPQQGYAQPQQQYNNQGYFPQSGINRDTMNPSFTLTDILQITDQQIRINGEMRRKLSELKQQNELLKNREMYFFPDKIAQQQRQIMKLEEFIIDQNP